MYSLHLLRRMLANPNRRLIDPNMQYSPAKTNMRRLARGTTSRVCFRNSALDLDADREPILPIVLKTQNWNFEASIT